MPSVVAVCPPLLLRACQSPFAIWKNQALGTLTILPIKCTAHSAYRLDIRLVTAFQQFNLIVANRIFVVDNWWIMIGGQCGKKNPCGIREQ